jgi:hypothetical protein
MDPTLPRRLSDHCPRCKGSLDCAVFAGVMADLRIVLICEGCYAELQDPAEPACLRPTALETLTGAGPTVTLDEMTSTANIQLHPTTPADRVC